MARTSMRDLRIQARKLGIRNARELDQDELEEAIEEATSNGRASRTKSRTAVKKAVTKRGPGRPRKVRDEDEEEPTPRRRGRPPGSRNKVTAAKTTTTRRGPGRPRKETTTASRTRKSSSRANPVGRPPGSGTGTRILVPDRIKWNKNFDFRDGSTSQYILNELRKAAAKYSDTADVREAVIEKLEPKVGRVDELTFINRSTGRPHKSDAALKMLRYRVNRTILDYCIETDQHEGSTVSRPNKAASSSRSSTRTATKTKRGPGRPRKVVEYDDEDDEDYEEEPAPRRRGRPPGSKNKPKTTTTTTVKRGPGRPRKSAPVEPPKRRGRPPGSKNKPKAPTATRRGPGRPRGSSNRR